MLEQLVSKALHPIEETFPGAVPEELQLMGRIRDVWRTASHEMDLRLEPGKTVRNTVLMVRQVNSLSREAVTRGSTQEQIGWGSGAS